MKSPVRQEPLDNPGWFSLNSYHDKFAIRYGRAARCDPEVLMGAAMPHYDANTFQDLAQIVTPGEQIGFIVEEFPEELDGWRVLAINPLIQMVCHKLLEPPLVEMVELSKDDVRDMLALVALTEPGPFLARTIELGHFWGVRQNGELVAMAGERLHLSGYCEISAVCTHPDFRGKGLAAAVSARVARGIQARGETPFLTLLAANDPAHTLYKKLGFRDRRGMVAAFVQRE